MKLSKRTIWIGGGFVVVAVIGGLFLTTRPKHVEAHVSRAFVPRLIDNTPKPSKANDDYVAHPKVAKQELQSFIHQYETKPNPKIQDQVGAARLKIGFLAAHDKNWSQARQAFQEAANQTKGSGESGAFGTINEQGTYQAIVTLEASGKVDEAKMQYRQFIKQRPLSALCMACYRRLVRLNGGKTTDELTRLIESATKQQDANTRFESAVCGPKTLAYLCEIGAIRAGSSPSDYKSIAKSCGTTDSGTTVQGMIKGLKVLGVNASAYRVNRQDLEKIQTPAIILIGDHFVTLLEVKSDSMRVYDTVVSGERAIKIPDFSNPDFFVNTILLRGSL